MDFNDKRMNELVLDTRHKVVLSKEAKIFAFVTGGILISIGFIGLYKLGFNSPQMPLQITLLITGILWIVKGVIGKEFFKTYRYIKIDSENIIIKHKPKGTAMFNLEDVHDIRLNGTNVNLVLKDYEKEYSLTWLNYSQIQKLKERIDEMPKI